jgi:hypothetical protein
MRTLRSALILVGLTIAIGCEGGSQDGRQQVTGTVSYGGQPVDEGKIVFEPEAPGAPLATGQIKGGKYEIEPQFGPEVGPYRVRIEGYRKKKVANMPPHPYAGDSQEPGVVTEQFLPVDYNVRTTLFVDIADEGENVHNFDLQAKR